MSKNFDILAYLMGKQAGSGGGGGGGGSSVLVVNESYSGTVTTLDKTFKQIFDGMTSGNVVVRGESGSSVTIKAVSSVYTESGIYEVAIGDTTYFADSEDGYPYYDFA